VLNARGKGVRDAISCNIFWEGRTLCRRVNKQKGIKGGEGGGARLYWKKKREIIGQGEMRREE